MPTPFLQREAQMEKIREIIERVDKIKPNAFGQKEKVGWIAELDGIIATEVMLMCAIDAGQMKYTYPDDLDSEPLVVFPHSGIYDLWLCAKIDFTNGEYNKYQNTMEMFNANYNAFVRWFASTYEPAQGYRKENHYGDV